jgi:hypothetical protein
MAMGASLKRVGTRLLEQGRRIGYRFVRAVCCIAGGNQR